MNTVVMMHCRVQLSCGMICFSVNKWIWSDLVCLRCSCNWLSHSPEQMGLWSYGVSWDFPNRWVCVAFPNRWVCEALIIMYIYHAFINALSAHMIHINLNMIFYTHVEHSPTKTIYIKYYKRWQGWAVSKVLWECVVMIPFKDCFTLPPLNWKVLNEI